MVRRFENYLEIRCPSVSRIDRRMEFCAVYLLQAMLRGVDGSALCRRGSQLSVHSFEVAASPMAVLKKTLDLGESRGE